MGKTFTQNQTSRPLFDALVKYSRSSVTPFDVPGHKMGKGIHPDFIEILGENLFKMDINSLKEMDNLSNPEGVIKQAEDLAAELFHADNAFFLVNGSTSGVQNMILSAVNPNEKILLPRNIHKSAINALVLSGAVPAYFYPEIDKDMGISVGTSAIETIKVIDQHPDAKAILLLHPTYYGFVSDLKTIIDYAHEKGLLVLVDESHGTHFYLDESFPDGAMTLGADMATISVHKTGGSLTQSSILLHSDKRISKNKVRSVINISQTSSASYLLMASLDIARQHLATNQSLMKNVYALSQYAKKELDQIEGIKTVNMGHTMTNHFRHDASKLLIDVSGLNQTGFEVYDRFKTEYNIQLEFGETNCVLAIISVGDTKESIETLITAFQDYAKKNSSSHKEVKVPKDRIYPIIKKTPREAFFTDTEYIAIEDAIGRISGDQLMIYPPGIPLVIPGEVFTKEIINEYQDLLEYGTKSVGSINNGSIQVKVLKEASHE